MKKLFLIPFLLLLFAPPVFADDLQGIDLQGAKLYQANLQKANLQKADLRGADFGEPWLIPIPPLYRHKAATYLILTCEQLRSAEIDKDTNPPGYITLTWSPDGNSYTCHSELDGSYKY